MGGLKNSFAQNLNLSAKTHFTWFFRKCLRPLLKDFLQKVGVNGKVKKGEGKNLIIVKTKGKPIFCGGDGEWKVLLEQCLQKDAEIVLLALGNVKYEVLAYLNKRKDMEILKLETRQMKKRDKGTGLKATVRSCSKPDNRQEL